MARVSVSVAHQGRRNSRVCESMAINFFPPRTAWFFFQVLDWVWFSGRGGGGNGVIFVLIFPPVETMVSGYSFVFPPILPVTRTRSLDSTRLSLGLFASTVSLGFTWFYRVLLGFTGLYLVILAFTGFYWALLGFTGFYWVILSFFLGFTWFYWVLLDFTEL